MQDNKVISQCNEYTWHFSVLRQRTTHVLRLLQSNCNLISEGIVLSLVATLPLDKSRMNRTPCLSNYRTKQ